MPNAMDSRRSRSALAEEIRRSTDCKKADAAESGGEGRIRLGFHHVNPKRR